MGKCVSTPTTRTEELHLDTNLDDIKTSQLELVESIVANRVLEA